MPRIGPILGACAVVFVAVILFVGHAAPNPGTVGEVWRRGASGDPGSIDPDKATTVLESNILGELFEGLVTLDADGKIIPGVASHWEANADHTVYRFTFRPDAKWSNGEKVTPDDFVFAFRRLMNPATGSPYANILYTLKNAEKVNQGKLPLDTLGVRAVSGDVLELALEHPVPYLLEQLTHLTALPLNPKNVAQYGDSFTKPGRLVSNGPFMLKDFFPNDRLVLVKNPYFHDAEHVKLRQEIFIPLEDRAAALRRFMAGEIDSYDDVPVDQIGFIRSHFGDELKEAPYLGSYYYAFDTRHPPFDDVRVRQALSMVIDRDFLAKKIWHGTMEVAYSFVPPGIESYGAPTNVTWKDEDIFTREDKARRLLNDAGYGPHGKKLDIEIRFNSSENHKATAVAVADMWKDLGITTHLYESDATSFFAFLHSGAPYEVARGGWFADYDDAQNYLFLAESDNPGLNYAHFSNAAYDELMRKAASSDGANRIALLHQAEALLVEQEPYVPLLFARSHNLVSKRLSGWAPNVLDHHAGRFISIAGGS
ncbi:MAG TPA: peptide ABC transporter substrate-binding protein [Methylovirgula sp.]